MNLELILLRMSKLGIKNIKGPTQGHTLISGKVSLPSEHYHSESQISE